MDSSKGNFFTNLCSQAINNGLSKGDLVRVIGKDEYKGRLGLVILVNDTTSR